MLIDKYNIMSYRSLLDPETKWYFVGLDGKMVTFLNSFADGILGTNNLIAGIVDFGLKNLYNKTIFEGQVNTVFKTTSAIWNTMFDTFKILFFAIAMFYVIKDFMTKGIQQAFIRLFIFMAIFGFNSVFFSQGDMYLKQVSQLSTSIQDEIVGTAMLGIGDADIALIDKESDDYKKLSPTDKMREVFFSISVFKPFALVNFGELAFDVGEMGPMPDGQEKPAPMKEKDFDKFLVKSTDVFDKTEQERIDDNVKENSSTYPYLTSKSLGNKYAIAIGSLLNTIFFGLVIFFLSLLKFVLEIIVLGLCVLLPISGMLSLLPPFQNALFKALGMIIGIFAIKVVAGLGIAIAFLYVGIIDSIIPPTTVVGFFAGLVVKTLVFVIMWKKRDWVVKFMSGGRVNVNTNNKYTQKMDKKAKELATKGAHKSVDLVKSGASETKSFVSGQTDGIKERIQDSGSSIRDQSIVNAAQGIREEEGHYAPEQAKHEEAVYNNVEPYDGNSEDRKEVSGEVGMSQTEFSDTEIPVNSDETGVQLDDTIMDSEESYEENRIDQTTYLYHDFEEVEEEYDPREIDLEDQIVEQNVSLEPFINKDIEDLDFVPENMQLDQLVEVNTEIEQSLNSGIDINNELTDVGDIDEIS
ncbi:CD3337/EF1877 family mobilome membrane protein [Carnobacterium maltaromaticum]|uniref:CD3337/EF1877 family mobilome membrane protein n=1 Tax=Carnobacterium maltaromaticum TaxID=2751 RepID=UPI0039BE9481